MLVPYEFRNTMRALHSEQIAIVEGAEESPEQFLIQMDLRVFARPYFVAGLRRDRYSSRHSTRTS